MIVHLRGLVSGAVSLCALLILAGCQSSTPDIPSHQVSIADFAAIAGGRSDNTAAFARAIDQCARSGGGHVIVPAGTWLTGPIHLRSNIDLHVESGATILFSRKLSDYPLQLGNYEGLAAVICTSPISADQVHDVSITGAGIIDGQGHAWRQVKKSKVTAQYWKALIQSGGAVDQQLQIWYPTEIWLTGQKSLSALKKLQPPRIEDYRKYHDLLRPPMVCFSNVRNLLLDGPTFRNSPSWNIHLLYGEHISVRHVTIFNPYYAQNGDGIDIDSCRDVTLTDSNISAGDDVVCLKSGRDAQGRSVGRPTENVTIARCMLGEGHGAIAIGSEMSGGIRNVEVYDCTFNGTDNGIWCKSVRGRGGVVRNINIHNIEMWNIKNACIGMDMYYMLHEAQAASRPSTAPSVEMPVKPLVVTQETPMPVGASTPQFRDITIRDIVCHQSNIALQLRGLPEMPLTGIVIDDADITSNLGGAIIDADGVTLRRVSIRATHVPGFQLQNARHLTMQDVIDVPLSLK